MPLAVKQKIILLPLLMLLVSAGVLLSVAPDAVAENGDRTIIMFVPDLEWPPYIINSSDGTNDGALVEIFKAVADPMGYRVDAQQYPDKRGWELLRSGGVDVHMKAKEWVKDPSEFYWSDPFMQSEDILIFRADDKELTFSKPESLLRKSIAAIEGFIYPGLEPYFQKKRMVRVDSHSPYRMLDMLAMGRVDAAVINRAETLWLFRNRPDLHPERFRMDSVSTDSAYYRYVFTKDTKWLPFIEQFNARLAAMKERGELKAILDQYK